MLAVGFEYDGVLVPPQPGEISAQGAIDHYRRDGEHYSEAEIFKTEASQP